MKDEMRKRASQLNDYWIYGAPNIGDVLGTVASDDMAHDSQDSTGQLLGSDTLL